MKGSGVSANTNKARKVYGESRAGLARIKYFGAYQAWASASHGQVKGMQRRREVLLRLAGHEARGRSE